jgi:PAS domain S-box-containing protein
MGIIARFPQLKLRFSSCLLLGRPSFFLLILMYVEKELRQSAGGHSRIQMHDAVKILLVDDEPRNLDALESILESSDCVLVRAQTPEQALYSILQNDFAAIVLDMKMPGMSGLELAGLIKQRKRSEHVPILFLTAHSLDESDVLQAYGVGGVDFLSKPLNPEILRSKIAVFANLFRTTRALASTVSALNAEVAERERAQDQLRVAKDELETRVLERTAELARANREIRDNEERLKLALAVAQVATWEWDLSTGKMQWSADPEILFGFPAGCFGPDLRISHAVHADDVAALEAAFHRAMQTGDFEAEYRAVRPDGSSVWIADRGRVVQDSTSQPTRIVGVSVDLTRRKRLEEALLESDRRKDEFLATLGHELRNPLAPILYAVRVLDKKGPATPELRWSIDIIERQARHMTRLIDDLLDVSRITRGTLELRKEPIELATVINAAVEASQPTIEQAEQALDVKMPPEPICLDGDSVRLAQVFSNLLNNASKYSRQPGSTGKIRVSVSRDGGFAVVSIRDSGMGIAASMLNKVFDMFTQAGRESGHSEGGLGIGLALARRLVEMHGGTIEAHSEGLGKGSEFVVRLPAQKNSLRLKTKAPSSAKVSTTKRRILIADDNADVLESFRVLLQTMGYEVETALDGLQALEKAEQFNPEVIALDLGMPKLDGIETGRRIRQASWGRDVVLIAITGWGNESHRRQSSDAGFNVHLVKPIDAMALVNVIEKIDQSKAGR